MVASVLASYTLHRHHPPAIFPLTASTPVLQPPPTPPSQVLYREVAASLQAADAAISAAAAGVSPPLYVRRPDSAGNTSTAASAARKPSGTGLFNAAVGLLEGTDVGRVDRIACLGLAPEDARSDSMHGLENGNGATSLSERLLSQQGACGSSRGGNGEGLAAGAGAATVMPPDR